MAADNFIERSNFNYLILTVSQLLGKCNAGLVSQI